MVTREASIQMSSNIQGVKVEISVVLGRSKSFPCTNCCAWAAARSSNWDSRQDDPVTIMANDRPVAKGEIVLQGDKIGVAVSSLLKGQQ